MGNILFILVFADTKEIFKYQQINATVFLCLTKNLGLDYVIKVEYVQSYGNH